MSKYEHTGSGLSLSGILLVIFVTLKLTDNLDWGWVWVLSPLWVPLACILVFLVLLPTAFLFVAWLCEKIWALVRLPYTLLERRRTKRRGF